MKSVFIASLLLSSLVVEAKEAGRKTASFDTANLGRPYAVCAYQIPVSSTSLVQKYQALISNEEIRKQGGESVSVAHVILVQTTNALNDSTALSVAGGEAVHSKGRYSVSFSPNQIESVIDINLKDPSKSQFRISENGFQVSADCSLGPAQLPLR